MCILRYNCSSRLVLLRLREEERDGERPNAREGHLDEKNEDAQTPAPQVQGFQED